MSINFDKVLLKFRELFTIAAEVKDAEINKCLQEADKIDIKTALCGQTIADVPTTFGGLKTVAKQTPVTDDDYSIEVVVEGTKYNVVPLTTILCYYAFARHCKNSEQKSTSTGLKIQQYAGAIILPDNSKYKRSEEEKAKADSFMQSFVEVYEKTETKPDCDCADEGIKKMYRVCFIK